MERGREKRENMRRKVTDRTLNSFPLIREFFFNYIYTRTHYHTLGFEKPSAIQQRAIMPILSGRDVIAQAQSGTGKTATISMVTLETIDTHVREPQVLVLSPTRELAQQIQKVHIHIYILKFKNISASD